MATTNYPVFRKAHDGKKIYKIVSGEKMISVAKTELAHNVTVTKNKSVIELVPLGRG